MKFLVFWYLGIPVMIVAMFIDWNRGVKPVSSLAWAGVIVVSMVAGWIKDRLDTKAAEAANDAAIRCKHGKKTYQSCKGCAEEFAYFERCALCGTRWDNRTQQHDHKMIPDSSGRPEFYLNGVKLMSSSSYWHTGSPVISSSYMPGMGSMAWDTRETHSPSQAIPVTPYPDREMKMVPPGEGKA
jgi:hypothetical protein